MPQRADVVYGVPPSGIARRRKPPARNGALLWRAALYRWCDPLVGRPLLHRAVRQYASRAGCRRTESLPGCDGRDHYSSAATVAKQHRMSTDLEVCPTFCLCYHPVSNWSFSVKTYEGKDIRNAGVVGHGDSGKTTLTAGLLFTAGATSRLLRVDEGNTITDFDEEEVQRKVSISTAIAVAEWKKAKINILDTPGYNIFINDTRGALVAADAALVVVDGVAGVEVQ